MKIFTIFLILFTISYSNQISEELKEAIPNTSGIEPIKIFDEDFRKNLKNLRLQSIDDEDLQVRIQKIINERLKSFNINNQYGISVAFYTPNLGIQTATAGYSDPIKKIPMTSDMTFQIASVTKWMVSNLIFKLQENGQLDLSDEISDYLPTYPNIDPNTTIAELLSHNTDIYDYFNQNPELYLGIYLNPTEAPDLETLLNNLPLYQRQDPTSPEYSNTNYVLLAKIIEEITGEDYYEYLKEMIIEPLDLTGTYSGRFPEENDNPVMEGWFNDAHWRVGLNRMTEVDLTKVMELSLGLGDLYSTPTDLVKVGKAWIDGDILTENSIDFQTTVVDGESAYGTFVEYLADKKAVFHTGSFFGYTTILYTIPEDEFVFAMCINSNNANFFIYPNRLRTVFNSIILDLYDLAPGLNNKDDDLKIHEFNITEVSGNQNGRIDPGEEIELNLVLRDVSGGIYNFEDVEFELIQNSGISNPTAINTSNTFIETGYSYNSDDELTFNFSVPESYEFDFIDFSLFGVWDGDIFLLQKDFQLPVGETKSSAVFDGSYASTVQIPLSSPETPSELTFEGWYNIGDISQVPGGQISSLAWIGYNAAVFAINGFGRPSIFIQIIQENGRFGQAMLMSDLNFGQWFHLAFTYNDNGQLLTYVNGEEVDYQITEGSFSTAFDGHFPQLMTLGSMPTLADVNGIPNFIGYMDEVRYWSRKLSESEIEESMMGLPANTDGLIANANFDGGVSPFLELEASSQSSGNFHAYYGENTSYVPGSFISSVEQKQEIEFAFYPNPASDFIEVTTDEPILNLAVFDLKGDKLISNESDNNLSLEILSCGVYYLQVKTISGESTKIFVKQ